METIQSVRDIGNYTSQKHNVLMHRNLLNSHSMPVIVSINRWIEWIWLVRMRVSKENQISVDFFEWREMV